MAYIDIDGTPGSLVPPFNPDKLNELLVAALTAGGFTSPPLVVNEVGPENTLLNVSVPEGTYTAQQVAQIVAILNAVAADPTRNNLTEDQQEVADLQNKLNISKADIDIINAVPGGLKDQINAANTGLKDRLLTNVAWSALT